MNRIEEVLKGMTLEQVKAALEQANKQYVFELMACEEYYMQESLGLFKTEEGALKRFNEIHKEEGETYSFLKYINYILILKGEWTTESFEKWQKAQGSHYWWYKAPFNHEGVFGIYQREIGD